MSKRPSFILFITDQHRADFLGCYGHPIVRTPNIDAMAARGTAFDRFYVASPVCMPNRASLMTGRMPSGHGVRFNGLPLSQRNVTFVELLRDAGYDTALIGKSHLQTFTGIAPVLTPPAARPGYHQAEGELREAVRNDFATPVYHVEEPDFWSGEMPAVPVPFYGFDHVELVTGHGDHIGGDYTKWLLEREPQAGNLMGKDNQLPHDYTCPQAVRTAVPPQLYSTSYIAERASAWLEDRKDNDKPFFLMVSWPDPHHPFNPPGEYWDMYDPQDMPVPAAFTANDWTPPPHVAGVLGARESGKANLNGMNAVGCSAREAQEAQALTCGMVTMIDDAMGRVQAALEGSGHRDDTVTIFTSDHGDHLGDHRLLFKGSEQYEQITRVPFIWADPQGDKGIRSDRLGQTLDIGATILERARIEQAWGMQGRDLVSDDTAPDSVLIQYAHQAQMDGLGVCPNVHSLRDKRYRISVFQGLDWGELYDLEQDPNELHNLWQVPDAAPVKARLLEKLMQVELAHTETAPAPVARA